MGKNKEKKLLPFVGQTVYVEGAFDDFPVKVLAIKNKKTGKLLVIEPGNKNKVYTTTSWNFEPISRFP